MTQLATTPEAPAPVATSRHVASLDGLRAVAVLAVLLYHAGFPGMGCGWMGVDLFFVISGFLITTLLRDERERAGRVSLPRFWGRRVLRLMPAYWLYVGSMTALIVVFNRGRTSEVQGWGPGDLLRSLWLYYSNYAPLFDIWEYQHFVGHLWSLAVEEQFYLIWPILFAMAASRRGRAERLAWGLVLASLLTRMVVSSELIPFRIYTRGLGIAMGCAFALTLARSDGLARRLGSPPIRRAVVAFALLSVVVPGVLQATGRIDGAAFDYYVYPIFCVASTLLVGTLWYGPGDRVAAALSVRPLVYVGRISYGIYLYHQVARYLAWSVVVTGLDDWPKQARYGLRVCVFLGLSLGIASMSYHLVERPFLRLRSRLR